MTLCEYMIHGQTPKGMCPLKHSHDIPTFISYPADVFERPFSVILALFLKAAELCSVNNCFILSERVTTGSGPRPLLVFLVPCVLLRFINL